MATARLVSINGVHIFVIAGLDPAIHAEQEGGFEAADRVSTQRYVSGKLLTPNSAAHIVCERMGSIDLIEIEPLFLGLTLKRFMQNMSQFRIDSVIGNFQLVRKIIPVACFAVGVLGVFPIAEYIIPAGSVSWRRHA